MGARGDRVGALQGGCSAGEGEVQWCEQAAPKTRVPVRALAAAAVRLQGSKAAEGKASRKENIFKAQRVNGSYSSQEERRPKLRRGLEPGWR